MLGTGEVTVGRVAPSDGRWVSQAMTRTALVLSHVSIHLHSRIVDVGIAIRRKLPSVADDGRYRVCIGCGNSNEPPPEGDGLAATVVSGADVLDGWCGCFGCLGVDLQLDLVVIDHW